MSRTLVLHFSQEWKGLTRSIKWMDARGKVAVEIPLVPTVEELEKSDGLVLSTLIPGEALVYDGGCSFTVRGIDVANPAISLSAEVQMEVEENETAQKEAVNAVEPTPEAIEVLQNAVEKSIATVEKQKEAAEGAATAAIGYATNASESAAVASAAAAQARSDADRAFEQANNSAEFALDAENAKAAAEAAAIRAESASSHEPAIINGTWWVWDEKNNAYKDTGTPATGPRGFDGQDGRDGYTPVKGKDYFDGKDGKDGYTPVKNKDYFDGEDGYSPNVSVTNIAGGKRVSITDASGTKTFDLMDGEDGYTPVKGKDYFDGADGYTPVKGKDYFDGVPGQPGADGVSPTVSVEQIAGGHKVTVYDAHGPREFEVMDGVDGFSPTITKEVINGGHRLTITNEKSGTQIDVMDGRDGKDGASGFSPIVETWEMTQGHMVSITTDAAGTKVQFPVYNGKDGKDGKDGGSGAPGSPGVDGVSPTVQVDAISGGHKVTITDKNGTQSFDVMDGKDGTGGGGASVQADMAQNDETQPDFVKNRTHWKEGGLTEILSETTLDTSNGITPFPGDLALKADTEYTVVWNGTTYVRTARSESLEGIPIIAIGNLDAFAGTGDTGEPFAIAYGDTLASIFGTPNALMAFDGSETATLSITADTTVYHKLDNRYIDAEWMASSYYTPEVTGYWGETTPVDRADDPVATFTAEPLKAGDKVKVSLTGGTPISTEIYEGTARWSILSAMYGEEIYCFGNEGLAFPGELPDTGEPFFVVSYPSLNECDVILRNYTEKHALGVGISRLKYNTLPERFLPESAKPGTVYVHGNLTDGSTRKETVAEIDTNLKAGKRVIYVHNGEIRFTVLSCSYDTEDNMSYLTMANDSGGIYFIGYANGWKFEQTCGRGTSLPSASSSDNGKFLRVVNGAWAAVALSNAEGGSF